MTPIAQTTLVFFGAGFGALGRYAMNTWVSNRFPSTMPVGILSVNVLGCLLIGVIVGLAVRKDWPPEARLLLTTGVLGGFTTFSTYTFETIQLLHDRQYGVALGYVLVSNIVCLMVCGLGFWLTGGLSADRPG